MLPSGSQPSWPIDAGIHLRPWNPADLAALRAAHRCPDIQRWHVRRFDSDDEVLAWIDRWETGWRVGTEASWAVVDDSDDLLGQTGLRGVTREGPAGVSVWVVPGARNRGLATRTAHSLAHWTFARTGIRRLTWEHSTQNQASCRTAEAAGFVWEETRSASGHFADGLHDMHVHARFTRIEATAIMKR